MRLLTLNNGPESGHKDAPEKLGQTMMTKRDFASRGLRCRSGQEYQQFRPPLLDRKEMIMANNERIYP